MLLKLLTILCSTHAILAEKTVNPSLYNVLPQHFNVQGFEPNFLDEKVGLNVPVMPLIRPTSSTICPANKILLQIESILNNLFNEYKILNDNQRSDEILNNINIPKRNSLKKNFAFSSSNIKSLRELLDDTNLTQNAKTKILVQYELPSDANLNCKQALSAILDILKNINLLQDFSRPCSLYENCNNKNILTKEGDENRYNNVLPSHDKYLKNHLIDSKLHWINLINYIASQKNDLQSGYETNKQDFPYITRATDVTGVINKLPLVISDPKSAHNVKYHPINNSPYQSLVTERILTVMTPGNFNNENPKLEIVGDNLIENNVLIPISEKINHAADIDGKLDVYINTTSDRKIRQHSAEDPLSISSKKKVLNGDESHNIDPNIPNILFANVHSKVGNNEINDVLPIIKSGDERTNLLSNLIQSKFQFKQLPQQASNNVRYPYLIPYYIDSNKGNSKDPNLDTLHNTHYIYDRKSSDQTLANINSLNTVSNQGITWSKSAYQTPYVGANPYFVNSKLVDYGQYVNRLHASNNLENFPRIDGVTNQLKLDATSDNSGVVELTYVLRRPEPVVYQPIYFVKYRMSYDAFLNNVRDLLQTQPQLRSNPAKLYQKLLTATKVAEVSPSLKGVGQQKLLQMVANNGALVKTKVVKVNDTVFNRQLEKLRNLNSNLTPKELINVAHSIREKAEKTSDPLKNGVHNDLLNKLRTQKQKTDKDNVDSSILVPYKEHKNNDFTTIVPPINYIENNDSQKIPPLR